MTRNQIEYLKLLETTRSNQAQEIELARANRERERQGVIQLGETERHNRATEGYNAAALAENARHNLESESHNRNVLAEQQRHNVESERFNISQLQEVSRHNVATEAESRRHNEATERFNEISFNETRRSNLAREAETYRSNLAKEQENYRSNTARERENTRTNLANESIKRKQLAETISFNSRSLEQRSKELEEQIRSHKTNERLQAASNITRAGELAEAVRSNVARESETAAHNRAWEAIMATKNFGTTIDYTSPEISISNDVPSLPEYVPNALPAHSESTNKAAAPTLKGRSVIAKPYQGISKEVAGAVTGNDLQIVEERYSDGSKKYFEEEIRHGKVTSRKQISQGEAYRYQKNGGRP